MATFLSAYLRMEAPDRTEPVTFYAPGAWGWGDPRFRALRHALQYPAADEDESPPVVEEQ